MIGIVWNPTKVDESVLRDAAAAAFDADEEVRWWETSADDPGRAMAQEALETGCDTVIAVGGDGTVRIVAEVLAGADAEHGAQLGIVPQGTGNLLARNLDIPLGNIRAALDRTAAGRTRDIDMGWVRTDDGDTETGFLVMIGFGLDANMLAETDDDLKKKAGWLAHAEAMERAVAASEVVDVTLTLDGGEEHHSKGHTLLVGNCGMIQGGITLLPDAEPDDGVLDLLLVSADGALAWMETLRAVVWDNGIKRLLGGDKQPVNAESAEFHTAKSIEVTLGSPQPFEIDGEEAGKVSSYSVRVQPGAVRILC